MAFDFVTSRQNKAHVTAEQAGALNIAIFGNGRYITKYAQGLEVSVASSNKINIAPGALIVDGRFVINERAEQASIANGTQGKWRKDLVILTLKVDASTGVGTTALSTIQGTPAATQDAAKDPAYTPGDLSKGQYQAQVPIARVILNGLTPTVEHALPTVDPLTSEKFEITSYEIPSGYNGASRNFWHVYRNGTSVTIHARVWLDQGIKNDAIVCPFLVPEGSRPPKVDSSKYSVEGYENIYYNTAFCPNHADVISALSVRPDGKIYMQDFGGTISRDWRYGTLTYTVAPK